MVFQKKPDDEEVAVGAIAGVTRSVPSILGQDVSIIGNLISDGHVQVDGLIVGDVRCAKIVVSKGAKITGTVAAQTVVVRGTIEGFVWSLQLSLEKSAHVEGEICHKNLSIDPGAFFDGKSLRLDDPLAEAPELETKATKSA